MSAVGDFFQQLQERQAEAMKQYQDTVSETMQSWQGAFGSGPNAEATNPGLPDAAKVADSYYSFASDLLKQQHEFTLKLIEAMTPAKPSQE